MIISITEVLVLKLDARPTSFEGRSVTENRQGQFSNHMFQKGHDIFFSTGSLIDLFLLQQGIFWD